MKSFGEQLSMHKWMTQSMDERSKHGRAEGLLCWAPQDRSWHNKLFLFPFPETSHIPAVYPKDPVPGGEHSGKLSQW